MSHPWRITVSYALRSYQNIEVCLDEEPTGKSMSYLEAKGLRYVILRDERVKVCLIQGPRAKLCRTQGPKG